MTHKSLEAVVILGCRLRFCEGRLAGALARRVHAGATLARELRAGNDALRVIVTGGGIWGGVVEADAMRDELERCGISAAWIDRERRSRSTKENAVFVAKTTLVRRVALVTCGWHLPRAVALFAAQGFDVEGFPAPSEPTSWTARVYRWGRERVARTLDGV
jgi:uncharacterized SAM-binding protein YcdF (DUF218 family)